MASIWIVDDDQDMARAVSLMLDLLGHKARHLLSARACAQSLLAGEQADLLVLDMNMPEVSGLDLLEFLRRRPEWRKLPVVMLTSEAADIKKDHALQLGADAYVTKPVTIDELEQAILTAFARHTPTS